MLISDDDREWIDARADQLFRENERRRGGIRPATVSPQDYRDYFVVQAAWERFDAMTRKPIPTSIGRDWQWLEQEEQPRLSDGYVAVMAVAPGKWMVRLAALPLRPPMPTLDARNTLDALLARGLLLPTDAQPETRAWAVVVDGEIVWVDVGEKRDVAEIVADMEGGKPVPVAIRVLDDAEGGA